MTRLVWDLDPATEPLARRWNPLRRRRLPGKPFDGRLGFAATWQRWLDEGTFPAYVLDAQAPDRISPSVENIVRAFSQSDYMVGTILVLAWGGLARHKPTLLARGRPAVRRAVERAARLLAEHERVRPAWEAFDPLGWSMVARSKTLHFLARGLGIETNPPVPIDNAAMVSTLYPEFLEACRTLGDRPTSWRSGDWNAYQSYMTAILVWTNEKGWTTSEVETTLFRRYLEDRS
jgi:hypothetical protein